MLAVDNLGKHYETPAGPLRILEGISMTLDAGEAAAIMGPSGSGKSTLLHILGGLDSPTEGSVRLDGSDPMAGTEAERAAFRNQRIGFVFQDHLLLPQCTVLENVLVPVLVAADGGRFQQRARELLDLVGLSARLHHKPGELSGGERQRVAIARALIRNPALLLCDEPTGNLDQASSANVAQLLLDAHRRENTILIVVTHNPEIAALLPQCYQLHDRKLVRTRP